MSTSRTITAVVVLTCGFSLSGCKGETSHKAISHAKSAVSSQHNSSSAATPSASSDSQTPSAATLWQTAQSKLRADKTLRVQFAGSKDMTGEGQGDQPFATTIEGETSGASTHVTSTVASFNMTVEIIRVQGRSYLKGNEAYWQKMVHGTSSTAKAAQNANRWVLIPESGLSNFSPSSLPQILHALTDSQAALPASTPVSESTFHGMPCWKIDDSTTQSLYVSRDTNELIGLTKSGDTSQSGNIHEFQFLDANKDFNITAPADAINP